MRKILLDTHAILWTITADRRLTKEACEIITNPDSIVYFSTTSLWEIALKNFKAPEKCPYNENTILELCTESGFNLLNIIPEHVAEIRSLKVRKGKELSNLDPFDRMLLAQAKYENMMLMSHDVNFDNYDESCILKI